MQTSTILTILELVAKYGLPAVEKAVAAWKKDTITEEDIKGLALLVKHPDEYKVKDNA